METCPDCGYKVPFGKVREGIVLEVIGTPENHEHVELPAYGVSSRRRGKVRFS